MYRALARAVHVFFLSAGMRNELQPASLYQGHLKVNAQSHGVRENGFPHLAIPLPLRPACQILQACCWSDLKSHVTSKITVSSKPSLLPSTPPPNQRPGTTGHGFTSPSLEDSSLGPSPGLLTEGSRLYETLHSLHCFTGFLDPFQAVLAFSGLPSSSSAHL